MAELKERAAFNKQTNKQTSETHARKVLQRPRAHRTFYLHHAVAACPHAILPRAAGLFSRGHVHLGVGRGEGRGGGGGSRWAWLVRPSTCLVSCTQTQWIYGACAAHSCPLFACVRETLNRKHGIADDDSFDETSLSPSTPPPPSLVSCVSEPHWSH